MKGRPVDQLVYECMFPKPKPNDPQNFQSLLQRQLVPEVRLETQAFYGHLSSQEAKYPGLDYSYQPHRVRLSRYPWHRRLFRAFDNLRLTQSEIASLTKWEGTRWAKERFEREQGVVIRDTTADTIPDWVEPELRTTNTRNTQPTSEMEGVQEGDVEEPEGMDEDDDSDAEIQSVGIELNERLRAAVAQREAGNTGTVMDEEWEQWLKDAVEAGGIPFLSSDFGFVDNPNANIPGTRPVPAIPLATSAAHNQNGGLQPRLLNAARLGQWDQIPDFLQNMVRQNLEANSNNRPAFNPSTVPSFSIPTQSRTASTSTQSQSRRAVPTQESTTIDTTSSSSTSRSPARPSRRMLRYAPALRIEGEPANEVR